MDEIRLVRHAETPWTGRRYCGRSDPPLSAAGKRAAGRIAAEIAGEFRSGVAAQFRSGVQIVCSPLLRARQTADAISSAMPGARLEIDERWAETDFGIAEGLTYEELAHVSPAIAARLVQGDTAIDWPGGETAAALAARVEAAWRDLGKHERPVLVVSHGGPLRIAIALATNRPVSSVTAPGPGSVWRLPRVSRSVATPLPER